MCRGKFSAAFATLVLMQFEKARVLLLPAHPIPECTIRVSLSKFDLSVRCATEKSARMHTRREVMRNWRSQQEAERLREEPSITGHTNTDFDIPGDDSTRPRCPLSSSAVAASICFPKRRWRTIPVPVEARGETSVPSPAQDRAWTRWISSELPGIKYARVILIGFLWHEGQVLEAIVPNSFRSLLQEMLRGVCHIGSDEYKYQSISHKGNRFSIRVTSHTLRPRGRRC